MTEEKTVIASCLWISVWNREKSESTEDFVSDETFSDFITSAFVSFLDKAIKRLLFSFFDTILSVSGTSESESLEQLWLCVAWLKIGEESFILKRLNDVFFVSPCVLGQKKMQMLYL